ncbi:Uncharacterized [Moorella glycerini]|uniref:Efflux pump membrane fusion protein n=1 Tax=Neomoorella stamsii TaxID=1266720 RepID=A0A9X7J0L2_9FIRM|nr:MULTISPECIES: biotin/lipoyl-binding protein [Moorella]PRR69968.1 putative efflux pump membrane fusion protein [Moorella stamsii]CEP68481.1 Uncharacterized [Moorella glycerini]
MRTWIKKAMALLAAGALALAAGCGTRAGAGDRVTVKAADAGRGKLAATVEISGALAPVRVANVVSKLAGQVLAVKADVGDRVQAGQVLVEIDTKELQAQLQQAEAAVRGVQDQAEQARLGMEAAQVSIDTAQIKLDAARKDYERVKALAAAGAASQKQLDDAQAAVDQLQTAWP